MRWRIVGMAVMGVWLLGAGPGPVVGQGAAEKAEIEAYLQEFDRKAHASAKDLCGELAAPFLAIRGGPLMKVVSASRAVLEQAMDPFPKDYQLQRWTVLQNDGRLAIGSMVYQTDDLPCYMTLVLARQAQGWKAIALVKATPDIENNAGKKFIQEFDKAAHAGQGIALKYFRQPCLMVRVTGQGDATLPQITELQPVEVQSALGIPMAESVRLRRSEVVACWKDQVIANLDYGGTRGTTRWLVLATRNDGRWQIAQLSRGS
jgi:hypothetical protein